MRGLNTTVEQDIRLLRRRHPFLRPTEIGDRLEVSMARVYEVMGPQPEPSYIRPRGTIDNAVKSAFRKVYGYDPFNVKR